jgi:FkbM family methyltransferase
MTDTPLYFQDNPLLFCRPGTLVDVGCNMGFHLAQFMMFEGKKHIVAYEPKRQLALELVAKIFQRHNGEWPQNIEIFNCAVGNQHGRIQLRTPIIKGDKHLGWSSVISNIFDEDQARVHYGNQFVIEEEYVQITTLDSQDLQNVTFLKIDVEGAEEEVLRGGINLIKRDKPIINIELVEYVRPNCTQDVCRLLEEIGYQGFFMYDRNQVFPIEHFRPELHQISEYDGFNVVNKKIPYVWEFQFIHQDDSWGQAKLREIYGSVQNHIPPMAGG